MAEAFHKIAAPGNFKLTLLDAGNFVTIQIDPEDIENLLDHEVDDAVKYIQDVKKMIEDLGGVVFIVREALSD